MRVPLSLTGEFAAQAQQIPKAKFLQACRIEFIRKADLQDIGSQIRLARVIPRVIILQNQKMAFGIRCRSVASRQRNDLHLRVFERLSIPLQGAIGHHGRPHEATTQRKTAQRKTTQHRDRDHSPPHDAPGSKILRIRVFTAKPRQPDRKEASFREQGWNRQFCPTGCRLGQKGRYRHNRVPQQPPGCIAGYF